MPQDAGYYHAAYVIVAVAYAAYGIGLLLRRRTVRRQLDARRPDSSARRAP